MTTPLDLVKEAYDGYINKKYNSGEPQPEPATPTVADKVEQVVAETMSDQIAPVKSIVDLVKAAPHGPDEIIADRFLCRNGGLLFPAPTGIGKSTFVIQTACMGALGREAYGLRFVRPTKFLYVQAENDESDLAGMRDGIFEASDFSADELKTIERNLLVLTESNRTGVHLIEYISGVIDEYKPDVLILDPIFSYLGASASEQAAVSAFLRNMLNPMMMRFNVASWLVHHTNKPPTGEQKREWQGGEFAYLGAGSAEWANWARATLTIRQIGLDNIFELRAGKRGARLGWKDPQGARVHHRYIAHAEGSICWQDADWDHVQEQMQSGGHAGRPKKQIDWDLIRRLPEHPFVTKAGAVMAVCGVAKCKDRTAMDMVSENMERVEIDGQMVWQVKG